MKRYSGRVTTFRPQDHYGFIGLSTVKGENGSAHDLTTTQDIFVHQDDCNFAVRPDVEVLFEVGPDNERGGTALRAGEVDELVTGELVLVGEDAGESHALADPRQLYVPPTPAQQFRMKAVSPEDVQKVLQNRPMPRVNRNRGRTEDAETFTRDLMARLFPQLAAIGQEAGADIADERFDAIIEQAIEDHKGMGMALQGEHMRKQAATYKGLRTVLKTSEDLLTPDTLIPLQYLPDLFMAVPVWYFWVNQSAQREADEGKDGDRQVHPKLANICDMVPGERWTDTFLMFNRRMRTLRDYQGDLIPPKIIARMRKVAHLFDHLVIMTPYHDVAGADWENIAWLRSIDPYVVGFIKGIPLMFVLGRFSDSGTFPLHSELVADTVAFLRANVEKLRGFAKVPNLYWYRTGNSRFHYANSGLGTELISHTHKLLSAFDEGNLFDWLRGENAAVPATR